MAQGQCSLGAEWKARGTPRAALIVDSGRDTKTSGSIEFEAVYAEMFEPVMRWIYLLGGPGTDLEGLAQEVFSIVLRKLNTFRGDAKLSTWLYRITANVVRNDRRSRGNRRSLWKRFEQMCDEPCSKACDPGTELERRRRERMLYRALDQLPDGQRAAVIAFELEGATGAHVAERLGISEGALWVRLSRARRQLKEALVQLDEEAQQ